MTDEEFNSIVEGLRAKNIEIDRPVKECDGWTIGERVRVIEDDENEGVYEGDEGVLVPEEVGSPEHGNVTARLYLVIDGMDSGSLVDASNIEPA